MNNQLAQLFTLWAKVSDLVIAGERHPTDVVDVLQAIIDGKNETRVGPVTPVTVASGDCVLSDWFMTSPGLWVSDTFLPNLLEESRGNVSAAGVVIGYADLLLASTDAETMKELPQGCVFPDIQQFLVHLSTLVKNQWGGEKSGPLLTSYENRFFVKEGSEVIVVVVSWSEVGKGWTIKSDSLSSNQRRSNNRVFVAVAA